MYELEKFIYYLKLDIRASKLIQHIGDLNKFLYIKQNEYIIVNCQYLNIEYCEKFIDYDPQKYFKSFIKFSYKAMAQADRTHYFKFNFSYNNSQTMINVNLNDYRDNLRLMLKRRFNNYKIELVNDRIDVTFDSSLDRDRIERIERRIDEVVEEFNRYNRDWNAPQTKVVIYNKGDRYQPIYYTINFYQR